MTEVMILKTCERLNLVAGDIYEAKRYQYDPSAKMTLLSRVPDGFDPECNEYIDNLAFKIQGKWNQVINNTYVPLLENEIPVNTRMGN